MLWKGKLFIFLCRIDGDFFRLLFEVGRLFGMLLVFFFKSDVNGGVDDRFVSIDCELKIIVGFKKWKYDLFIR